MVNLCLIDNKCIKMPIGSGFALQFLPQTVSTYLNGNAVEGLLPA